MSDLLLITPPFTQLNTPYPATAYLKGFLNTKDISSYQVDLGIEVILELFNEVTLRRLFEQAKSNGEEYDDNISRIIALSDDYVSTIDRTIAFLQGHNPTLARQICSENLLPQASKFDQLDDMEWAFGAMGMQDKAKHLATLYLEDISDFIVTCVDPHFGFSRYAERLGRSANSFDELYEHLQLKPTFIDEITQKLLHNYLEQTQPKLVCLSVPFPGNLYSSFRCGQYIKAHFPTIKVAMGGGFANTELRSVTDTRVFDFFDYICLDDGELPIELVTQHAMSNSTDPSLLKRTFLRENGEVIYNNFSLRKDYKQAELGTPDYSDLKLDKYISVIELANPMHSLWSDGRWNKLTMAHGCYWGKCTFCDVSLDYIKLYEPIAANILADRMEQIIAQTGERGFHFVDEAAPPALMRALAIEIIRRKLVVTWWTNIRFEKSFTADLCKLLAASGCIAVSGGLEVASDRLLELIQKGVTVEQVAKVTNHFTSNGIMVHAYLMYGYPTQTVQETIDSLEMVRQLFEQGVIQSGFWHQFALTAHSPIGLNPEEYRIKPVYETITFANNDVAFEDETGIDHAQFSFGLKKSLFNYMHGLCFDFELQDWFDFRIPATTIEPDYIANCLEVMGEVNVAPNHKVIWLGKLPEVKETIPAKGKKPAKDVLIIHEKRSQLTCTFTQDHAKWLLDVVPQLIINRDEPMTYCQLKSSFEVQFDDFDEFWAISDMAKLRDEGYVVVV